MKSSGAGSQGNFFFSAIFHKKKLFLMSIGIGVIPSVSFAVASKHKTWVEELVNSWVWWACEESRSS